MVRRRVHQNQAMDARRRRSGERGRVALPAPTMSDFRFVDLFAGIGGFHVALESLGGHCVLASESDPLCQSVYRTWFPQTTLVGDVCKLTADPTKIADQVPDHDVLAAGFPCQPFSKSGAQLGVLDRTRGTLFHEIMQIVRAKKPTYVMLENVRNLAGPRHSDTWSVIIDELRRADYVVDSTPIVMSPHLLPPDRGGTPQVRERVFILAQTADGASGPTLRSAVEAAKGALGWDPRRWSLDGVLQPESEIEAPERYALRPTEIQWLDAWEDFINRLDEDIPGFPIWADEFRSEPRIAADTPLWKATFLRKNSAFYVRNRKMIDAWRSRHQVDTFPSSRKKFEWQARGYPRQIWDLLIHFRPSGIRVRPPTYVPALVAITQTSVVGPRRRRITPREAARLQGFPERLLDRLHEDEAVAYRQLGNAVNVGVVRFLAELMIRPAVASSDAGWARVS